MKNSYSDIWFQKFMSSIPVETTKKEVEFIKSIAPVEKYGRLLDLCCGEGRHSIQFDKLGYKVIGIDSNSSAIKSARSHETSAVFKEQSVFELNWPNNVFDVVVCLWQSFGFGTSQENSQLIRMLWHSLSPDGVVFLDIYNKDFFVERLGTRTFAVGQSQVTETKKIMDDRLVVKLQYDDSSVEDVFDWQIFSPQDIAKFMGELGFIEVGQYSDYTCDSKPHPQNPRGQYLFKKVFTSG